MSDDFLRGPSARQPIVSARGLSKKFGNKTVVDNVNFDIYSGEIFGFLGPNGAGKTTTVKMLTTLLKPSGGQAKVCGYDIVKESANVRNSIGVVHQEFGGDEDMTGLENVAVFARLYGVPKSMVMERSLKALEVVGLTDAMARRVSTYSGGMKRRLALGCGLVHFPKALFLDEPTLGLDVQIRRLIWKYIRDLRDHHGITIFMTTHYLEEADVNCDRIAIINKGKIVRIDPPSKMKEELGEDLIYLTIEGEDADLSYLMETVPFVKHVSSTGQGYRIKVARGGEALPAVLDSVKSKGYIVSKVTLSKPSLDDVYLEATGLAFEDERASEERKRKGFPF